ncbi:MAG: Rne/Rng family ribonuclease [Pseudomonadota bacterium]
MGKKMLIDATHPEETRVVVVDGNKVDDFDFESINKRQLAGNIYLAKVTRVEPSLQAAFVDYGGNRHGFLAFSEIHPDYYQIPIADREALLAEEERAAREEDDADSQAEAAEPKPADKKRSRRSRSSRKSKSKQSDDVAGLEVIALDEGSLSDVPAQSTDSLAIMDVAEPSVEETADVAQANAPADAPAPSNATSEAVVEEPTTEEPTTKEPAPQEVAEAPQTEPVVAEGENPPEAADPAPEEPAPVEPVTEEAADDDAAEPEDASPKPTSMAESAGLDDDSVSEDIPAAATEAKPDKPRTEAQESAAPEASETADQGEARADAPAQADEVKETAPEDAPAEAEPEAAKADGKTKSDTPKKRTRRSRKKKSAATEEAEKPSNDDTADDKNGEDTAKVESVGAEDLQEEVASARARRRRSYKIQDVVKVRQIMLVQVVKEERGNKGAALTTYLSLAGRYCVLMPNTARGGGISRKITQAGDRKRLREVIDELEVPKGMGLIVRTAGAERTRPEIKRDYEFLCRQWEQVRELTLKSIAPTLIYEEGSLIKRSIRDLYSKEIDTILVEGEIGYREAKDYMKMLMPSHAKNVQQYGEQIPLFSRYQVESYLNGMFSPTVQLKSGGYIVIGVTEALVAVDVNSGRATKQGSIEETALQTNLEAADEVARQCRLRDLAGLIVIDFIDMEENRNNRAVEKRIKDRLKNDRARIQIGRISSFGLMEMSRQRLRPGILEATTKPCPHCQGTGIIRSDENMALSILREVEEEGVRGRAAELSVTAPVDVTNFLLNHKRDHIAGIEARCGTSILIMGDPMMISPDFKIDRSKQASRTLPQPTAAVTADSVAIAEDAVEVVEADADEAKPTEERQEGDGKSRRRRGKRGGRRRRNQEEQKQAQLETEAASEPDSDQTAVASGDADPSATPEETPAAQAPGGDDPQPTDAGADPVAEADALTEAAVETAAPHEEPGTADPVVTPDTAAETEIVLETVAVEVTEHTEAAGSETPEAITDPEVEATPELAPEPAPAKPKRRGWWSLGK